MRLLQNLLEKTRKIFSNFKRKNKSLKKFIFNNQERKNNWFIGDY